MLIILAIATILMISVSPVRKAPRLPWNSKANSTSCISIRPIHLDPRNGNRASLFTSRIIRSGTALDPWRNCSSWWIEYLDAPYFGEPRGLKNKDMRGRICGGVRWKRCSIQSKKPSLHSTQWQLWDVVSDYSWTNEPKMLHCFHPGNILKILSRREVYDFMLDSQFMYSPLILLLWMRLIHLDSSLS